MTIDEKDYIRDPTSIMTTGIRLAIAPFGSPPNVEDDGMNVLPGHSTSIALKEVYLNIQIC